MNPFDWTGPEFLSFYIGILASAIIVALVVRWLLRTPDGEPTKEALDLSPYEVAYLRGREAAAIDAALVQLIQYNVLAVDASTRQLSRKSEKLGGNAPDLEKVLFGAVQSGSNPVVGEVRAKAQKIA